jgi:hypothetical protein
MNGDGAGRVPSGRSVWRACFDLAAVNVGTKPTVTDENPRSKKVAVGLPADAIEGRTVNPGADMIGSTRAWS